MAKGRPRQSRQLGHPVHRRPWIQTGYGGGILLLEDFGAPDAPTPLHAAIDVESVRRGIVADPNRPDTATPKLQFYFYDACRINPAATAGYEALQGRDHLDGPRGARGGASWVCFGARPKDYAYADPQRRVTLYSQAFLDCLESRAPVDADGCTVQFSELTTALRQVVKDLAAQYGEEQKATVGGDGDLDVPVHRRRQLIAMDPRDTYWHRSRLDPCDSPFVPNCRCRCGWRAAFSRTRLKCTRKRRSNLSPAITRPWCRCRGAASTSAAFPSDRAMMNSLSVSRCHQTG